MGIKDIVNASDEEEFEVADWDRGEAAADSERAIADDSPSEIDTLDGKYQELLDNGYANLSKEAILAELQKKQRQRKAFIERTNSGRFGFGARDPVKNEKLNSEMAQSATEFIRVNLRTLGYRVEAVEKKQEFRQQASARHGLEQSGGGGANTEQHPKLADSNGINDIITPHDDPYSDAANNNALRNRLSLGISFDLSASSAKAEHDKKHKQRIRQNLEISSPRPRTPGQAPPRFVPS